MVVVVGRSRDDLCLSSLSPSWHLFLEQWGWGGGISAAQCGRARPEHSRKRMALPSLTPLLKSVQCDSIPTGTSESLCHWMGVFHEFGLSSAGRGEGLISGVGMVWGEATWGSCSLSCCLDTQL